jgi:hypothetical protein
MYRYGANALGFSTGGAIRFYVDNTIVQFTGQMQNADGSAAAPTYTFFNDIDTGLYRAGGNAIGFACGGTEYFEVQPGFVVLRGTSQLLADGGTASLPDFTFNGDNNTGIYHSGADAIGIAIGGAEAISIVGVATTGAQTATFSATNKPGTGTAGPAKWLPVKLGATTYYIPMFGA